MPSMGKPQNWELTQVLQLIVGVELKSKSRHLESRAHLCSHASLMSPCRSPGLTITLATPRSSSHWLSTDKYYSSGPLSSTVAEGERKGAGPDSLSKHIRLQVTTFRSSLRLKQSKSTIYCGWKGVGKDATWYLQQDSQFPRRRSKLRFLSVLHYRWHLKGPGKYTEGDEWASHILGGGPESVIGHELDLKPKVPFKLWT